MVSLQEGDLCPLCWGPQTAPNLVFDVPTGRDGKCKGIFHRGAAEAAPRSIEGDVVASGFRKDVRKFVDQIRATGRYTVTKQGKGWVVRDGDGREIPPAIPANPGDHRALKNARAALLRSGLDLTSPARKREHKPLPPVEQIELEHLRKRVAELEHQKVASPQAGEGHNPPPPASEDANPTDDVQVNEHGLTVVNAHAREEKEQRVKSMVDEIMARAKQPPRRKRRPTTS